MPKLTDTQLVILASAAKRDDGSILPPPRKLKLDSDAAAAVFKDLIKKSMIAEQPAVRQAGAWRTDEEDHGVMLVVADAGLRAIGAQPAQEPAVAPKPTKKEKGKPKGRRVRSPSGRQRAAQSDVEDTEPPIRTGTKQARMIDLLRRPEGATVGELAKATGWQHHSIRGIIAGALKKRLGFTVTSQKTESGERRYQIAK